MPKRDLILLALDDSPTLQLMDRALRAISYETAIAKDIPMLDTIIQESIPALLMIGEQFDGVSGVKTGTNLLQRFPTMPVLLYTERESAELIKLLLHHGFSGYLCPPLRNSDIVGAAERSMQRARQLGDWLRREVKKNTASLEQRATFSESELSRYETIFTNIQDGVIILDAELRIQMINNVVLKTFEIEETDLKNKPVENVIQHPDMDTLLKRAKLTPLKYHEVNFDDGRIFNAQFTPIAGIGAVITMQDISYLKHLDRMKNEFIHTVSHDLRSPLTAVLGYTELIERVGSLSEQQSEFMGRIRSSVENITTLVNDLLDLSRLEAGFDGRREMIQFENVVKYALDNLESQARLQGLHLETDIGKNLPPLRANPIRLRQLVDNLVSNAIKYTAQGGKINISLQAEDSQLIFSVTDTGYGIPKAEQPRIFEKFFRGTNVPDQVGGTGIGLSIVKSIVDAHQGRIWVESTPGEGSTFIVVFPTFSAEKHT